MTRRFYSNTAPQLTLTAGISNAATTCSVSAAPTGWPAAFPYFAAFDVSLATMEIVLVTGAVGTTLTIVRGQDGTSAVSHASGATVDHVFVAKDLDEPNAHIAANTGIHGVTGSVVGTTDAQSLSSKTLLSPIVTGGLTVDAVTASGASSAASAAVSGLVAAGSLTVAGVPISGSTVAPLVPGTMDPMLATDIVSNSLGISTANTAWYGRIMHPGTFNISTISVGFNGGTGTIGCALFRDSGGGAPGALVAQSIATTPGAGSAPALSLGGGTFTVSRGDWFAVVVSGTATALVGLSGAGGIPPFPTWRAVVGTGHAPGALVSNPAVATTRVAIALWGL